MTQQANFLSHLEPILRLSPNRLKELASLSFVEKVSKNLDPFRMNVTKSAQALYLLKGDLGLVFEDKSKKVLKAGTSAARHPVGAGKVKLISTVALTEVEIVRIDLDLLDIMMTWDQLSGSNNEKTSPQKNQPQTASSLLEANTTEANISAFSANNLQSGAFSRLPPANIQEMFKRMQLIDVVAGQVVITQGAEGDYYYLIEQGLAEVTRVNNFNEPPTVLAELNKGQSFGQEALVSDNKRNATVTMKTSGKLHRLNKKDFVELLKAPLINELSYPEANAKTGAVWLDVRFESEFNFEHLPNAINAPLNQIRNIAGTLDQSKEYIIYCQTGRRSSAAAFILIELGFKVFVLAGGTRAANLL